MTLWFYNNVRRHVLNLWIWLCWRIEGKPTAVRPRAGRITKEHLRLLEPPHDR